MDEYISREALLKAVEKMDRLDKETNTQYEYDKEGYILLIQNAPAADVEEVKHGYWYEIDSDVGWELVGCSVCRKEYSLCEGEDKPNYCPHCGAKMDGERK